MPDGSVRESSVLTESISIRKSKDVRCPYCVESGNFKTMDPQSGGDWFVCSKCGHLALPSDEGYRCTCSKCVREKHREVVPKPTFFDNVQTMIRSIFVLFRPPAE